MKRYPCVMLLATLSMGLALSGAWAQDISMDTKDLQASTRDLKFNTLDLVFNVEDTGGKVQDLAMKETETEIQIELAADVLFEFDKADILPKANEALQKAAAVIREKGKGNVRIEGHSDAKGADDYNQKLSLKRAKSVQIWFVEKGGLKAMKFETIGWGEAKPVAPNTKPDGSDDPEGRQKNRRVEITVKKF
jgi:outer membrane protein OmpA-like peptidoglycan-associated protein